MTNAIRDLAGKMVDNRAIQQQRPEPAPGKPKRPLPQGSWPYIRVALLIATAILIVTPLLFTIEIFGDGFLLPPHLPRPLLLGAVLLFVLPFGFFRVISRYELPNRAKVSRPPRKPQGRMRKILSATLGTAVLSAMYIQGGLDLLGISAKLIDGQPTSAVVTVSNAHPGYSRTGCAGEIDLKGYWIGHLCGQPDSLRDSLHAGDKLQVSGTGTAWGLYYDKVGLVRS